MTEDPAYYVAAQLADVLNAAQEASLHLMISDDEQGYLEYVLQEPGHFSGWKNVAAVAWDGEENRWQVVRFI